MSIQLTNQRNGVVLAERVSVATGFLRRLRGWIGRSRPGFDEALWIPNCGSIHTCFMRFPIDVIFLRDDKVVALRESLEPFRLVGIRGTDVDVVELAGTSLRRTDTRLGDRLQWVTS